MPGCIADQSRDREVGGSCRLHLKSGRLKFIEASFSKLRHGNGGLTGINFSEKPPEHP